MSQCANIKRFKGSTKPYQIVIKKNNVPTNINGWTFYLTIKTQPSDSDEDAVINKKVTEHPQASDGIAQFDFDSEEVNLSGNYFYSIDFKDNEGNQDVLFFGKIKFISTLRNERN